MFLSSVRGIQPAREEDDENKNRGDPPAEFHGARFWARTEFLPNEFLVIELGFRQAAAVVAPRLLSPARVVIRSASRAGHRTSRHVLTADGTFLRRWRRNWFSSGHGSQSLACESHVGQDAVAWSTISDSFGYQRFQDRPFSLPPASPDRLRNASRCFAAAQERGARSQITGTTVAAAISSGGISALSLISLRRTGSDADHETAGAQRAEELHILRVGRERGGAIRLGDHA